MEMKRIKQLAVVLIVLMSTIGFASATTTSSPNEIEVNVFTDAITTVTVTHEGNFQPDEIRFTIYDFTDGGITDELEGLFDGSIWTSQATTSTYLSQVENPAGTYTTTWEFQIRDVIGSIDDEPQMDKEYNVHFQVTSASGQYDSSTAPVVVDASNTGVTPVPEFPTIALPIAAILGLAFIFQRRREED